MRFLKVALCLFLNSVITIAFSQEVTSLLFQNPSGVFIETNPDAVLYEMYYPRAYITNSPRVVYDISSLKHKRIRRSSKFEVIDLTHIHNSYEYDAYVVKIKDKHYLISSSDIKDNTFLKEENLVLVQRLNDLRDSLIYSKKVYNDLLDLIDSRKKACEDSIAFLRNNQDSIIYERIRRRVENNIQEQLEAYKNRRNSYNKWVSSLPLAIQKDANILAIPESYLSVGYYGVCGYTMTFINLSEKKVKYLTWSGRIKNAVGDYLSCEVHHTSSFSGKYTGPCNAYCSDRSMWEPVIINGDADTMELHSVRIVYTDGSSVIVGKQSLSYLSNIPREMFFDTNNRIIGYDMISAYDNGVDMDTEISNALFLNKNTIKDELKKEELKQYNLSCLYNDAKRDFNRWQSEPSVLYTYLRRGNVIQSLRNDEAFIKKAEEYYAVSGALENYVHFIMNYFGYLDNSEFYNY